MVKSQLLIPFLFTSETKTTMDHEYMVEGEGRNRREDKVKNFLTFFFFVCVIMGI